jgi:hypothetical protein
VKFCWLAPVVFTSLCWRGFFTLKSCVSVLWFLFRSSLLPIAFVTTQVVILREDNASCWEGSLIDAGQSKAKAGKDEVYWERIRLIRFWFRDLDYSLTGLRILLNASNKTSVIADWLRGGSWLAYLVPDRRGQSAIPYARVRPWLDLTCYDQ